MRCRKLKNRLLLLAALIPCILEAQVTADCPGAIVVCGDQLITLEGGPGLPDFNNPDNQLGDCQLTGETESVWLYFRFRTDMPDSSIIEFTIDPVEDGEIDYDFSLYAADTPCDSLGSPVRCSYAWVFSNNQFSCGFCPLTGLGNGELDVSEGPFGNGYLAPLAVYPGQGFYLYVNEFYDDASLSSGFNISFGGSAAPYLDCLANPNCPQMVADAGRDSTVCSGDIPFQLIGSATFTTGYEIYTWTGANGEEAYLDDPNSPQPTVTFPPSFQGEIVYVLTVESGECIHRDTLRLNVLPTSSFSLSGPASFCSGDTITLTASSGFDSYRWSNGSTAESIEVSTGGLYSVTVTAAGNNCAIAKEMNVTEHSLPQVNISEDSILCTGDTLQLDAGPGYPSYTWQDGSGAQYLSVTEPGIYSVEVVDTNGCSGSGSRAILEIVPPEPEINGPAALCPDEQATLSLSESYSAYQWASGEPGQQLTISGPGLYIVQVWDEYGCQGADTLNIAALPGADPQIFGPDSICYGANTPLEVSPVFDSFLWSTNSTAPSTLVDATGDYSVTVTNAEGCSAADTFFVELLSQPQLSLPSALSFCENETLDIDAGPGFTAYNWSTGDAGQVVGVSQPGVYSVTVTGDNGCSNSQDVTVSSNPIPQPEVNGTLFFCQNTSTTLALVPGSYPDIRWSTGGTQPEETFDATGEYSVEVTDTNGCIGSYTFQVEELGPTPVDISGDSLICDGATATLDAGPGYSSYSWSTGAGANAISVSSGGSYTVTVTNGLGCEGYDTLAVRIQPLPEVTLADTMILCAGNSLTLDAGSGPYVYNWSGGQNTPSILIDAPGHYEVEVTDTVGCSSRDEAEVLESELPVPQIDGTPNLCPGSSSLLAVEEPYEAYLWPDGTTGSSLLVTQPGLYSVTVTDAAGCQGTTAIEVEDVPAPQASITGPPEVCDGATAILDAGNHTSYLWSNGFTGRQLAATEEGLYNVVVTNNYGCRDTAWAGLRILPLPDPGLQEDTILCEGGSVVLQADPGFTYYLWEDGSAGATREVDAPGSYVLIVSDGSCSGLDTVEVVQQPAPQPVVLGGTTVCPGEEVTLEVEREWPALAWSTGSTANSITVTEPGSYAVMVEDSLGCPGTGTALVENFETVPPALDGDRGFCPGGSATLSLLTPYTAYNWSTGSSNSSITVNSPGNYSVTATDANGCNGTASMPVFAFPPPQANIGGETQFCEGGSTQIFAFGNHPSYAWSNGDTTKLIEIAQAGDYTVTITSANGCQAVASALVTERTLPQPEILGGQFCLGDSSVLYVEGQFETYLWENGSQEPTLPVNVPGLYGLTVTDGFGCTGAVAEEVEELPLPEPEIIGGSPICLGVGATTDIAVDGDYQEFVWNTGERTRSIAVGTTDVYSVVVTDANGCLGMAEFTLEALPAPSLDVFGDTAFCQSGFTVLEAVTDGESLLWFDGSTGTQATIEQPGTYFVTAFGDNGCETTDTIGIEEIVLPEINAGAPQSIDCREEAVQLGSSSNPVDGLRYTWNGPGIDDGNRNLPMPQVSAPGLYTVEVVQTTHLCSGAPAEVLVEDLRYQPEFTLNVMDTLDCSTPTVAVASVGPDQGAHFIYQWYDASGTPLSGENGQSLAATAAGAYSLAVTDTLLGCSASETIEVAADYDYPQVNAGPEGLLNCYVTSLELSGSVISESTGLVYTWTTGDGNFAGPPQGLTPVVDAPGLYILTVLDQTSGCEGQDSVRVRQDIEAPVASAGEDQEIDCVAQEAILDGGNSSQGAGFQYEWRSENGITIGGTLQPTVNQPGAYYLTVTNLANGCSSIDEATVLETDNYLRGMQLDAIGPLCSGDRNGLIAVNEIQGGTAPFLFSINGEPFVSQPRFANLPAGVYEVSVQDAAGCEYSLETFLEDGNDVEVRLGSDLELQLGDEIILQALTNLVPEEIREVVWSFPVDTFPCMDPKCLVKELQILQSTLIRATVIDTNGCRDSDEIQLILNKGRNIYIPNAFSPNGDGANDRFTIFANADEVAKVRRLMIMTRWGEQVFAQFDFPPNVPHMGWDGMHRGKALDPAVFAYFAEIEFVDGEVELFEGSLTLVK